MDGGACVFGVTANVTAFDEDGEDTTPPQDQNVRAKSMWQNRRIVFEKGAGESTDVSNSHGNVRRSDDVGVWTHTLSQ